MSLRQGKEICIHLPGIRNSLFVKVSLEQKPFMCGTIPRESNGLEQVYIQKITQTHTRTSLRPPNACTVKTSYAPIHRTRSTVSSGHVGGGGCHRDPV
jgi:hypothetical protein